MSDNERVFEPDLYKKFWKSKTSGGFIAIRPWFQAGKLSIDVGETATEGGLVGNTQVWAPVVPLATYLRALANDTASKMYPNEEYIYYGGGNTENGPVSRILKVAHWYNDDTGGSFEAKTGHFKAKESSTGAFLPDMKSPLSTNKIKVTRVELAEVAYVLDHAIAAFTREDNWLSHLNGKERG